MFRKKLLFVSPSQFGYLTDYYYYCKYLKDEYSITFLCFDQGLRKLNIEGLKIKYVSAKGNKFFKFYRWLRYVVKEIHHSDYDIIFSYSFRFCSIIRLFTVRKQLIVDIRTGSVKRNILANYLQNLLLRFDTYFFDNITILSKGLIRYLRLNPKKCHWLPLGAELVDHSDCGYNEMNLLYVGTLKHRNLHETIDGFARFYEKFGEFISCSYNIFGFGSDKEEELLKEKISELNLSEIVKFHGRKNFEEIRDYYRTCNIGVSYVPITDYFEFQPPTKTFEYILSGMVCIGTSTFENIRLINKRNGILCRDTPFSFYEALRAYYYKKHLFRYSRIISSLKDYKWHRIVNQNLKPYLRELKSDA